MKKRTRKTMKKIHSVFARRLDQSRGKSSRDCAQTTCTLTNGLVEIRVAFALINGTFGRCNRVKSVSSMWADAFYDNAMTTTQTDFRVCLFAAHKKHTIILCERRIRQTENKAISGWARKHDRAYCSKIRAKRYKNLLLIFIVSFTERGQICPNSVDDSVYADERHFE